MIRCEAYDAGVFTWDLSHNLLFADGAVASLFGLCPSATYSGLPLQTYIDRIHAEDKPAVARSIHEAVLSGRPARQQYRVAGIDGRFTDIIVMGQCFRDTEGNPYQYTGIAFPEVGEKPGDGVLLEACMHAHWLALESGRRDIAESLLRVMHDVGHAGLVEKLVRIH